MTIAEIILKQREAKGWTQQRLATLAGVNRSTIVNVESGGDCLTKRADRILSALGIEFTIGGKA